MRITQATTAITITITSSSLLLLLLSTHVCTIASLGTNEQQVRGSDVPPQAQQQREVTHTFLESSVFTSELDNEIRDMNLQVDADAWFREHIAQSWEFAHRMEQQQGEEWEEEKDGANAMTRRRYLALQSYPLLNATSKVSPFLMCLEHPDMSGYQRLSHLLFSNSNSNSTSSSIAMNEDVSSTGVMLPEALRNVLQMVSNTRSESCVQIPLYASLAQELRALDHVLIVPMSPVMKMRDVTLDKLHSIIKEQKKAVKFTVQFGNWIVPDEMELASVAEDVVQHMIRSCHDSDQKRHRSLYDLFTVLPASSSSTEVNSNSEEHNVNYLSSRHEMWSRSFHRGLEQRLGEGVEDSSELHCCADLFEGLWHTIDSDTNSVTYVVAGQPHTYAPSETSEECIQSFLAALSSDKDIVSITTLDDISTLNANAQWITQSSQTEQRPWFNAGLTGKNQIISISDTGVDVDNCYFYDKSNQANQNTSGNVNSNARKIVQYYTGTDAGDYFNGHGTHTAGILAGKRSDDGSSETNGLADGMAPAAKIAVYDMGDKNGSLELPTNLAHVMIPGMSAGAYIHSASWGRSANYDVISNAFDKHIASNPNMLVVVAAGNTGYEDRSGTILEPGNAKNVLTVGATLSAKSDLYYYDKGRDYVAYFSSRGPTNDGRIKPDVMAPGRTILSAGARPDKKNECDGSHTSTSVGDEFDNNTGLYYAQGTSMATPVIAGNAALVRQYFMDGYYPTGYKVSGNSMTPSAALLKAVLINGAMPLLGVDNVGKSTTSSMYDNAQGFGRVNLQRSLFLLNSSSNPIYAKVFDRQSINDGQSNAAEVSVALNGSCNLSELSVTLVWTDPAGATGCKNCLLNDLDLSVTNTNSGKVYFPNGLNKADTKNNVERVRVNNVVHGDTFKITVTASNLSESATKYALAISGCLAGASGSGSGPSNPAPAPTTQPPTHSPIKQSVETTEKDFELTYNAQSLESGLMFDVITKDHDIEIYGIDLHLRGTETNTIHILQIPDESHIGNERGGKTKAVKWKAQSANETMIEDASYDDYVSYSALDDVSTEAKSPSGKWVLITDNAYAVAKNTGSPSEVSNFPTIFIPKQTTSGLYITGDTGKRMFSLVDGEAGDIFDENDDIAITVGTSVRYKFSYPRGGYVMNGALHYRVVNR